MPYDEALADRIRQCFDGQGCATEKKMFGGLCFLINGNMVCGVTSNGPMMVRVGRDAYEESLSLPHARPMDFTGKALNGMVYVEPEGCRRDSDLKAWVERGISFAASLPAK